MFRDVDEALRYIKDRNVAMVDLKTADPLGRWRWREERLLNRSGESS